MKAVILIIVILLLLPWSPVAAQERCVDNPPALSTGERSELETLRGYLADDGGIRPHELVHLRVLEAKLWPRALGVGNGWIAEGRDSCTLYVSASGEPILGTRIYRFGWTPDDSPADRPPGSGQQTVVTDGPARIRSGPGLEHERLLWCNTGWPLTVWPPAQNGWLPASCYGANGWIHESLVRLDDRSARPDVVPPPIGDRPASGRQALVIDGPARIRSGPGLEHERLLWCNTGWPLTVWPPAQNGWLPASCYGANGWIHESLVRLDDRSAPPDVVPPPIGDLPASGEQAVVISGPAHIRSGPGSEHPHLRWCGINWSLTVWPPAQNGWLPASCYGANGWVHESLVSIDVGPAQTTPVQATVSGDASGKQAVVINGPAHIRSGPGSEHPHLRWCGINWSLTVWPPAQNGWLPASCYGANGWVHESLVSISD